MDPALLQLPMEDPGTSPLRVQGAEQPCDVCSHLMLQPAMVTELSKGQTMCPSGAHCPSRGTDRSITLHMDAGGPQQPAWGPTCPDIAGNHSDEHLSCLQFPTLAPRESSGRLLPRRHNNLQHTGCLSPLPEPPFPLASPVPYVPKRTAFPSRWITSTYSAAPRLSGPRRTVLVVSQLAGALPALPQDEPG